MSDIEIQLNLALQKINELEENKKALSRRITELMIEPEKKIPENLCDKLLRRVADIEYEMLMLRKYGVNGKKLTRRQLEEYYERIQRIYRRKFL